MITVSLPTLSETNEIIETIKNHGYVSLIVQGKNIKEIKVSYSRPFNLFGHPSRIFRYLITTTREEIGTNDGVNIETNEK